MFLNSMSPRPSSTNLTGSARTLNDVVVTFYNAIQKWKSCLIDGVSIIQDIQTHIATGPNGRCTLGDDADVVEIKCENIGRLISTMQTHIKSMKDCQRKIQNLCILNQNGTVPSPCFSWSYPKIVEGMQTICEAYSTEMAFRRQIVSSLQTKTLKQLNIITVFWVHCGQVDSHIEMYLEALLRECSLK